MYWGEIRHGRQHKTHKMYTNRERMRRGICSTFDRLVRGKHPSFLYVALRRSLHTTWSVFISTTNNTTAAAVYCYIVIYQYFRMAHINRSIDVTLCTEEALHTALMTKYDKLLLHSSTEYRTILCTRIAERAWCYCTHTGPTDELAPLGHLFAHKMNICVRVCVQ